MYGDFDWSRRENENQADLYTRGLIAISDNAKKSGRDIDVGKAGILTDS